MYFDRALSNPSLKRFIDLARSLSGSLFQLLATLMEKAFSLNLSLECCFCIFIVLHLVPLSEPTKVKSASFFVPTRPCIIL